MADSIRTGREIEGYVYRMVISRYYDTGLKKTTDIHRLIWTPALIELEKSKIRDGSDRPSGEFVVNITLQKC